MNGRPYGKIKLLAVISESFKFLQVAKQKSNLKTFLIFPAAWMLYLKQNILSTSTPPNLRIQLKTEKSLDLICPLPDLEDWCRNQPVDMTRDITF